MGRPPSDYPEKVEIVRSDPDSVRRSFRVPVGPEDGIRAVLKGKTYEVADISPQGISIHCKESDAFTLGQVIEDCRLILPGQSLDRLTARVIHFSGKSEGKWTNGLQWVDLTETAQDRIVEQVSGIKQRLVGAGPSSAPEEP